MSRSRLAILAVMVAVGAFYLWTASEGRPFPLGQPQDGHYNLMARALVKGQLHLDVTPRPELFALVDPYDPAKNAPFRLHDATLYHGRYYLYYGIAPALVSFVPWRLLGLGDLPETLASADFAIGAFLCGVLLLRKLILLCAPATPPWLRIVAVLVLGLANGMPFILRGPSVYEVAISAGAFFLLAAALAFASAGDDGRPRPLLIALGSLSAALAVASRPNHLFVIPLLLAIAFVALRPLPRRSLPLAAAAVVPLAIGLALIAGYNLARFGSPFEFGTRYQLSGNHPHGLLWLDPRTLLPGLYFNFLAPPSLRLEFPFVFLERRYPGTLPPGYFGPELIAGVLWLAPFLLLLAAARPILRHVRREQGGRGPTLLLLVAAIGLLNPLVTSFLIGAANQRYVADYVGFLVIPALVLWLAARGRWPVTQRRRRLLSVAVTLSLAWACAAAVALSFTGYEDALRRGNPALHAAIARRFSPLRSLIGRLFLRDGRAVMRLHAAFPERAALAKEPLLGSGTPEAQDVVLVHDVGPGRVAFSVDHAGALSATSAPVRVRPGHFHAAVVDLDRVAGRVVVTLDGQEAARLQTALGPVVRDRIWLGRGARGKNAPDLGRFSGGIVSESMGWALPEGPPLPDLIAEPVPLADDMEPPPASKGDAGRQWASAAREGVLVHDGERWRFVARYFLDRVSVARDVALDAPVQPLVSSGDSEAADVVEARTVGGGQVVLAYRRSPAGAAVTGPPLAVSAGPHLVSVTLDRPAGRVHATVDGRTALDARADLLPLEKARIAAGRLPAAGRQP